MIFKLHYFFLTSGACAIGILLGVFIETYTDASSLEIGALLMVMPFTGIIFRPIICSMADREQAHRKYILYCLLLVAVSYSPFVIIPYLGISDEHPRICWYILVVFKVIGDIAFGGMASIGDALAINYAHRIGTEFSVYRVWGTISWITFGLIIGQINEVPFIPKYVPGFMILIGSTLLNMTVIWLWPDEYFKMVPADLKAHKEGQGDKKENPLMKSLMPKEVVLAKMGEKLRSLFGLYSCGGRDEKSPIDQSKSQQVTTTGESTTADGQVSKAAAAPIDKKTQFQILAMLLHRDPRIILYIIFFIFAGLAFAPLSFFIISLSGICHEQGTCQFSELTGYIQVAMASTETVFFIYVKWIKSKVGRVNMCIIALLMLSIKFLFYGTIYSQLSPYYALFAETLHGLAFAINITLMIEMGHLFANEVEFILPELMSKGIIKENSSAEADRVKLSLSATMQALLSTASDGLGRGLGALIYGLLLEIYSFETLWLIIGTGATIACSIAIVIYLFDHICKPQLGLDVKAKLQQAQQQEMCQITC